LNLLAFAGRVAFDATGAAVDGITAETVRSHRNLILRIAVQAVMADFMRNNHQFVGRILMFGDIDEPSGAIEKAENALADDAARLVVAKLKIVVAQSGGDKRHGAPVAFGSF
jgi:hypothetical protein